MSNNINNNNCDMNHVCSACEEEKPVAAAGTTTEEKTESDGNNKKALLKFMCNHLNPKKELNASSDKIFQCDFDKENSPNDDDVYYSCEKSLCKDAKSSRNDEMDTNDYDDENEDEGEEENEDEFTYGSYPTDLMRRKFRVSSVIDPNDPSSSNQNQMEPGADSDGDSESNFYARTRYLTVSDMDSLKKEIKEALDASKAQQQQHTTYLNDETNEAKKIAAVKDGSLIKKQPKKKKKSIKNYFSFKNNLNRIFLNIAQLRKLNNSNSSSSTKTGIINRTNSLTTDFSHPNKLLGKKVVEKQQQHTFNVKSSDNLEIPKKAHLNSVRLLSNSSDSLTNMYLKLNNQQQHQQQHSNSSITPSSNPGKFSASDAETITLSNNFKNSYNVNDHSSSLSPVAPLILCHHNRQLTTNNNNKSNLLISTQAFNNEYEMKTSSPSSSLLKPAKKNNREDGDEPNFSDLRRASSLSTASSSSSSSTNSSSSPSSSSSTSSKDDESSDISKRHFVSHQTDAQSIDFNSYVKKTKRLKSLSKRKRSSSLVYKWDTTTNDTAFNSRSGSYYDLSSSSNKCNHHTRHSQATANESKRGDDLDTRSEISEYYLSMRERNENKCKL